MAVSPLNLANIQGDVLFGLPKQTESFFFFQIDQVDSFQTNLANLVPLVTTAEQTKSNISEIQRFKKNNRIPITKGDGETVHPDIITVSGVNIAFSAKGLQKLNITGDLRESLFTNGMKSGARSLGDLGTVQGNSFVPDWDDTFMGEIHGVTLVTGDSRATVDKKLEEVKSIFLGSVKEVSTVVGDVRPDEEKGNEHFGYRDGISNPSVEGVDAINPGQTVIDQGVALLGRGNDASSGRPDWALDGSFMAFRKLPQLVPEFDKFLLDTAGTQEAADLMGARFVGRWKSGAPIVTTPTKDDPELGADPTRNNDFHFTRGDQSACPFAAHIRKMNPRGDLGESGITPHMVLRRGIPFGPEVSSEEKASNATSRERGLLFVCYQTSIGNGFSFLQQAWANAPSFPTSGAGFDPIIGQTNDASPRPVGGAFANNISQPLNLVAQFVNSKGGEYFFSPSIPTLRDVFAKAVNGTQ
ncbi:Dyp-type peroxidase [Byssothecium circinans]|uniref:Dyp-type peroxidase n=1 Tax=Byssothecium circinans TaxID=147558 RepID=A0A6A5UG52_9PLEO|nr:Dyp-type peroxidase [Byssothecium circinans]